MGNTSEELELETLDIETDEFTSEDRKSMMLSFAWLVLYIVFIVGICMLVLNFVIQRTIVDGSSMKPTLADGDNIIVSKMSYWFSEPERFDIIVFTYDKKNSIHYIKRVIGLPGDTVQIINGSVYINGELLKEDVYGSASMNYAGIASEPITLGEGEYFVLGDNRNESSDSRMADVGIIHAEQIEGKAWLRIYPFSDFGLISHIQ